MTGKMICGPSGYDIREMRRLAEAKAEFDRLASTGHLSKFNEPAPKPKAKRKPKKKAKS